MHSTPAIVVHPLQSTSTILPSFSILPYPSFHIHRSFHIHFHILQNMMSVIIDRTSIVLHHDACPVLSTPRVLSRTLLSRRHWRERGVASFNRRDTVPIESSVKMSGGVLPLGALTVIACGISMPIARSPSRRGASECADLHAASEFVTPKVHSYAKRLIGLR